jgi:2'-5' RNA ligase
MAASRETTRTFIAIEIPQPLDRELAALQRALSADVAGCRWVATVPFHSTLAFLGNVPNRDLSALCSAIAGSISSFEPFDVQLDGLGAFPTAKDPRVLWAGLTAPRLERFLALRTAIVHVVEQSGYPAPDQKFHPHVTLGRNKPDRRAAFDLTGLVETYRHWSGGRFTVHEIVTFASTPGPSGPCYTPISRAPLARKKTEAPP